MKSLIYTTDNSINSFQIKFITICSSLQAKQNIEQVKV